MIKAVIDDKEIELKPENLKFGEGFALITPESIPSGYYNEEAVQKRIQDRLKNTAQNARKEAEEDADFHKRIFSKYNVSIGDDGKPKGLKPDIDVEELKSKIAKDIAGEYETKISDYKEKLTKRDKAVVESAILSATSGTFKDEWVKPYAGNSPLVVKNFADQFTVDDQGRAVVVDEQGEVRYKGDGSPMTPKDYFSQEDFKDLLKDQRQRSSGFGEGGGGGSVDGHPSTWTVKQKNEFVQKHGLEKYKSKLREKK